MKIQKRIYCPSCKLTKTQRIVELIYQIERWIYSDELTELIKLFGGQSVIDSYSKNIYDDIGKIKSFATVWDYRSGRERWTVKDNIFVEEHQKEIMVCATVLGLKDTVDTEMEPDYILPLGGARASNRTRPAMARKLIDDHAWNGKRVIALSGARPISDEERSYMDYALDAATEYDAMNRGLEAAFGVNSYSEDKIENDNINMCSAVREYNSTYRGGKVYSVAAPSSDPENRRANSADTFDYFIDKFDVRENEKILLVTSCIYVPFQSLKFMDLAIDNGFEVDCVGSDIIDNFSLSKTSNYLQEIKGTIDAMHGLVNRYH